MWSTGTTARRAVTTANGTVVEEAQPVAGVRTFAKRVEVYLRAFETGVTGYSRLGGEPILRVSGSDFNRTGEQDTIDALAFQLGYGEINDGWLSATVTNDSLRRYRVELNPTSAITVVEELEVTRLGATTVRRPAWAVVTNGSRPG